MDKHSPDREGFIWIGKEKYERKAYPHRVYADRNRIRLRVIRLIVSPACNDIKAVML